MSIEESIQDVVWELREIKKTLQNVVETAPSQSEAPDPVAPSQSEAPDPVAPSQSEESDKQSLPQTRDAIKRELDRLGIEYGPKQNTKTLSQKLQQAYEQKTEQKGNLDFLEEEEPKKQYQLEDVRSALINVANSFKDINQGKEAARKLIYDVGQAKTLSEVDPANYGAIVRAAGGE